MNSAHHLAIVPAGPHLADAVDAFLAQVRNTNTARSYGVALRALVAELGSTTPLAVLAEEPTAERIAGWFVRRWGGAANATANARLDALRSAVAWWQAQCWLAGNPLHRIHRRPRTQRRRPRVLDRSEIESLLTRPHLPLRERVLWRMLYETAARVDEVLGLDVPELDLRNRQALVRGRDGATHVIGWQTATARLLPGLLAGRRAGPVFLTDRRARVSLPSADLDLRTGRARLSYRRAAECFEQATRRLPGGPWTLCQLRHSALTHAAEDSAATAALLTCSGHVSVASLARRTRGFAEVRARWPGRGGTGGW
ncbi:tyrosine-type recombinase/integrase [Goodfellowiella coeruleoviolacea]|uniref:Integrase/recombinase XerD n=1 Tax=Goodfellowiella coeruleoviolacea TaxID=334858 RepID=A0AAE3KEZ8_9PSEU|nr:tyrosine-type recombinase/integrase [Goodfellowiella coeruleoviolacea]MCP2163924.1 integrase/recombinase XerD [Goodfellowiella coeruleoviolacea]